MRVGSLQLFFSLMLVASCFGNDSFAQAILKKTALIEEKSQTVETLLEFIGRAYGVNFIYSPELIHAGQAGRISANERTLSAVLDELLTPLHISYEVYGKKNIVLNRADRQNDAPSRQTVIRGRVLGAEGSPLVGVSILEKGTENGATTSDDGSFSITVADGNAVLMFSYIGYFTKEVPASADNLTVVLEEDLTNLEEVVVVGYGTQKRVNLTGAITSVKTDDIGNIPAANLSNTLAGRIPGATVVGTSGLAGASSSIRIRGSFQEPLYVINGVIKGKADFDALDVNEVASINFLKDAASAAVYGSKAGNGVILVTTKQGIVQKPSFDYKGSYSFSNPTRPIQDFSATEEIEYVNQMAVSMGQPKPYGQEIYDYFKDKSYRINDYIWQTPTVQQHNLGVRGGSEILLYNLSLGTHNEKGSYKNLDFDRYNFRSDVTANISKNFKINLNLSGNQRNYHRWYWPYDGAEDFNVGDFFRATFNWTRLYPFYVDAEGNPSTSTDDFPVVPGAWHPVELMVNSGGYRDLKYRNLDGILRFDLDLSNYVDGLSTSLQGHYNASDRNMKSFVIHNRSYIFQPASATNRFVPGPIDPTKVNIHNLSATYPNIAEDVGFYNSYQFNWYLRYDKNFGLHNISALAVYEQAKDNGKNLTGRADDLLTTAIDQIYNASSDNTKRWFSGSETQAARESYIGRLNYTFSDKYIAEFSFRYDGNYKFAPGHQWGFFPSGSAAWRLSQEDFLRHVQWLTELKLRGSYGTTGNDTYPNGNPIPAFQWSQTYGKNTGFIFGNSLSDGLAPGPMPNPLITWSTSAMWNVGMDFGVLNNRLTGAVDYFEREERDILGARLASTPSTLGATLPDVNYAERSWKGIEFNADWNDRVGDLDYTIYGNLGYAVDQWDVFDEAQALTDGTYKDNWRSRIGKPANRVYGLISEGIIRTQDQLDAIPDGFTQFGRSPKLGYLLFKDIRGANFAEGPDGKIDDNDFTYLSDNGAPRINYGIGFRLQWKGLAINAHFQGVGAYERMVSTRNGGGVFQVDRPYFSIWASDYWTPENPEATYPRVTGEWNTADVGGAASTFWLRNGAYFRLKNIDLGYALPQQWFSRLGVQRVQFFVNATNLFSISGLDEHDPEQNTLDSYPLMRTFTGGLNINF
ncbi:SusC/RagA family TonB-linked outer membrane protein [Parapedobacter sp.]